MPPLTLDGTTGVSAVQAGAVESGDLPAGSVVQVKQVTKTNIASIQSLTYVDVPGLSVSIAPSSASNKILVIPAISVAFNAHGAGVIVRDGNILLQGDAAGNRVSSTFGNSAGGTNEFHTEIKNIPILDSPNTTSSVTYGVQVKTENQSGYIAYINRSVDNRDGKFLQRVASTMTVMEIAG